MSYLESSARLQARAARPPLKSGPNPPKNQRSIWSASAEPSPGLVFSPGGVNSVSLFIALATYLRTRRFVARPLDISSDGIRERKELL
jgi:hypothetical protein